MVKKNPSPNLKVPGPLQNEEIDWEMRPGGMLVQRREDDDDAVAATASSRGPMVKIDVAHGPAHYELFVPAHSTFGDMKLYLAKKTGLEPHEQKLLFRGKEKEDGEHLHVAGVKDNSKVVLLEDRKSEERKVEELNESNEMPSNVGEVADHSNGEEIGVKNNDISKAFQEVAQVRAEVDKLAERVSALEVAVGGGTKVSDKEFAVSTELLMKQLLKLDSIKAEGEAKMQRKAEVRRVQSYVDAMDALRARNNTPVDNRNIASSVATKWETFDSGVGCLSAPNSKPSSTEVNRNWERFH